jgi:hypothetical protein
MSDQPVVAGDSPHADQRFFYLVIALLLLIIALLGGLWVSTRARALQAERLADRLSRQEEGGRILLRELLKEQPLPVRVYRAGLASRPATLDDKTVSVLHLPARMAETLGFLPGDVVVVEQAPPTTASLTQPEP